jgi:DNA polymerase III epsilon subunit-like protein
MVNFLILDTETTGLPKTPAFGKYFIPNDLEKYNKSRILEVGFIIYDENFNIYYRYNNLRKPENFTFGPGPLCYEYGEKKGKEINDINLYMCENQGISIKNIFDDIIKMIEKFKVNSILAYNIRFDINVLLSEAYRINHYKMIHILETMNKYCIMDYGWKYMSQTYYNNATRGFKFSAETVYNKLYNNNEKETHRALDDCELELKILQKLPDEYKTFIPIELVYQ